MLLNVTILRRKKNARIAEAAVAVHGDDVAAKYERRHAPFYPEGETPDMRRFIHGLGGLLSAKRIALEQADDAHLVEESNRQELRRVRDAATTESHQRLLDVSQRLERAYGKRAAEAILGLGPGLRAIPDQVLDVGRRAFDRLADPDFHFPRPSLLGAHLDAGVLREQLAAPLARLALALDDLDRQKSEFDRTLRLKVAAVADFDNVYAQVTRILQGIFRLVGEHMLAERIRPRTPAPRSADLGDEEDGEEEDDDEDDGDGEEEDDEDDGDGGEEDEEEDEEAPPVAEPEIESESAAGEEV